MTDDLNIGDTVDIPGGGERPRWRGEVLGFGGKRDHLARVLCVHRYEPVGDHDVYIGESTIVPVDGLGRSGDPGWPWREHDGCDDVDVTGRARPYHRHAVTGKAHGHPGGQLAHTHQTPDEVIAQSLATVAGRPEVDDATDALARALGVSTQRVDDALRAGLAMTAEPGTADQRERHTEWVSRMDVGTQTDTQEVFALLRDVADTEPLERIRAAYVACTMCGAEAHRPNLPNVEPPQPVPHLISCPWVRVTQLVGVKTDV